MGNSLRCPVHQGPWHRAWGWESRSFQKPCSALEMLFWEVGHRSPGSPLRQGCLPTGQGIRASVTGRIAAPSPLWDLTTKDSSRNTNPWTELCGLGTRDSGRGETPVQGLLCQQGRFPWSPPAPQPAPSPVLWGDWQVRKADRSWLSPCFAVSSSEPTLQLTV